MKKDFEIIWKEPKGKSFEDLVSSFLKCMFPNTIFKQTEYIHDGGKDFYSIGNIEEERIWIEAKNYNNRLELSKFSNTFIMADISEINRIIIFSMSEITQGAKINIARYAAYHNKLVSTYAGKDIWHLFKKYLGSINLEKYVENCKELIQEIQKVTPEKSSIIVNYEYYYAKQFNLTYRHDKDNYIKKDELINLPLHSLMAQEVHITNNDLFHQKQITLDYSEYEHSSFEIFFHGSKSENIILPPASTCVLVVFFKIVENHKKIRLPNISFKNNLVSVKETTYQTECCWLGEVPYLGAGWETLQCLIKELNEDFSKKIVIIEGKSGVGKTRFLHEMSSYYFRKGYRIISLDFRSIEDLSLKNALKYILSNIYVLDTKTNDDIKCIEEFGELYRDFYDIIFNDDYDCVANIDKLSILFITLFQKKNILLLIDNIQDIGSETVTFFERILSIANNQNDFNSYIVLCFNIDYIFYEKTSGRLLVYGKQLNVSCTVELKDFTLGDAKIYLHECLDPRGIRTDIYSYCDEILNRFGTNPFVLKQLMLYLKQRKIITFTDSLVYVSDFNNMKIVLSELPININNILQYRYLYLLHNIKLHDEKNLHRIIWCILFLGKLKSNWISNIKLDYVSIRALIDFGFIEYNENAELVFCHQLIEKSFCLFFLGNKYVKNPFLAFIDDNGFLRSLFEFTNRIGKINLCIENMLLRTYLNNIETESFELALKKLANTSPRDIMIPLIINSLVDCLNAGINVNPQLEFKALYAVSMACEERYDVDTAAKYTKDLVNYEQETYRNKLIAKDDIILFFKNYVFQLPIQEKYPFLDWLLDQASCFNLPEKDFNKFLGWLHNRYSKNLCSEHKYEEAQKHAQKALDIALNNKDFYSAAEAEIEYGNIYAYNNAHKAVKHWKNCVKYILKCNVGNTYIRVYQHGYYILYNMLNNIWPKDMSMELEKLLEYREKTFLYQRLYIDDIYANYYLINYLDGNCSFEEFKQIVPNLIKMKTESYMHTSKFTILATYKLFTVYRLICDKEPNVSNIDITISNIFELIKNGIFEPEKLPYSTMILYEIFTFCQNNEQLTEIICHELPNGAMEIFKCMGNPEYEKYQNAITPLSNKHRQVNLLHFNYIF